MSRESRTSQKRKTRRRVIETKLPTADIKTPAHGWGAWESRARAQLDRAAGRAAR